MFSTMLTIRKKVDITREDFIDYYEHKHAPLIGQLLPATLRECRRNYVIEEDPLSVRLAEGRGNDAEMPPITVITEARFDTRAEAETLIEAFLSEEILPQILDDEANFIEPGGVRWSVVEVWE